jgi:hypothetical protein
MKPSEVGQGYDEIAHIWNGGVCIFSMGSLDRDEEKTDSVMGPRMYYSTSA